MATRKLVKCKSQSIPGDPQCRNKEIAKTICTLIHGRDLDPNHDTFSSIGQYAVDGVRLYCLLDSGPPESKDAKITVYRWDSKQL
jgi:hypothetical protein